MKAIIDLTVLQYATDRTYGGDIHVEVPDIVSRDFTFEMLEPNSSHHYSMTLKKEGVEVLRFVGNLSTHFQLAAYSPSQHALFKLLFLIIFNAVKETQRLCGGNTNTDPIAQTILKVISMIGNESICSIHFQRVVVWNELEREAFEQACEALK